MDNGEQKPCQNRPNVAFPASSESNFLWEIVPARHFFAAFSFEQGPKRLKLSTFLVFPVFWGDMNLAGNALKIEKTILDRSCQIHTENCCNLPSALLLKPGPT
jgi:hypothetical protein